MRRRIRRRQNTAPDLDITAFMNLMVILVPFLLITAVFSRITVLDLYLPPENSADSVSNERFLLEIVLRKNEIGIYENSSGFTRILRAKGTEFDYEKLGDQLAVLKLKFPGKRVASILSEPDVSYDVLIQVMDHVRMRETGKGDNASMEELFPGISIGDAPRKGGKR